MAEFVEAIRKALPPGVQSRGQLHVFADEYHRTQSSLLHDAMKAIPSDAVVIGFTGTPLLKSDKQRSIGALGGYMHTYKFNEVVWLAVVQQLGWIRRQQARFAAQPRESRREMVSGESHQVFGQRRRLRVVEVDAPPKVERAGLTTPRLQVRPGADRDRRARMLQEWYRAEMKQLVPELLARWAPVLGVTVGAWGVKRMKTKWGSCTPATGRIWLNLDLARHRPACIEHVVVHELAHLVERRHDDRFRALLARVLPAWASLRAELSQGTLANDVWRE